MAEERQQRQQEGPAMPARREERMISPFEEWADSPLSMMRRIHEEMDRMFDRMFSGFGMPMMRQEMRPTEMTRMAAPPIDVWETEQDVIVRADLPGADPENIEIYTTEDGVRIRAETKHEEEKQEKGFYRAERRYGRFERWIELPTQVKPGESKATFRHGVLEIRLPKTEQAREKMKRVPVEVEEEEMAGAKGGETEKTRRPRRSQQQKT